MNWLLYSLSSSLERSERSINVSYCYYQLHHLRKESAGNAGVAGNSGLIPGLGRSPGGGNGNPLHCSCLGNRMDKVTWRTIHSPCGCKESDMIEHARNEE